MNKEIIKNGTKVIVKIDGDERRAIIRNYINSRYKVEMESHGLFNSLFSISRNNILRTL